MAGISKKTYTTKKGVVTKYVITYRDIWGKQHTTGNFDTIKEAKKELYKYQDIKRINNNYTNGELFNIFFNAVETKFAKNTINAYSTYINIHLVPILDIKYGKNNVLFLQEFFNQMEKDKPYTAHNVLKFCKGAINYLIKKKIITDSNIFNELDNIKRPPKNLNHLELNEILRLLEFCKENHYYKKHYVFLYSLIGAGLRLGEILALEKSDFEKTEYGGILTVTKQITANELKLMPKTSKGNRKVHIFKLLADLIENHINNMGIETNLIFPNTVGKHQNPENVRNRFWKKLLRDADINKRIRLHDLRGSYIDLIIASGLSGKFAQNQAGHEDWNTTYNIYAQNSKDGVNDAMKTLNNLFSKKCEQNVSNNSSHNSQKVISIFERRAKNK
jgi:integrase